MLALEPAIPPAAIADDATRRLLELPPGAPIIHLVRTAHAGERAVEVCDAYLDAAAFQLSYELPAE